MAWKRVRCAARWFRDDGKYFVRREVRRVCVWASRVRVRTSGPGGRGDIVVERTGWW